MTFMTTLGLQLTGRHPYEKFLKLLDQRQRTLIEPYMATPKGRGQIMDSMVNPSRNALDFGRVKYENGRRTAASVLENIGVWLTRLEVLKDCFLDDSEPYDRVAVSNLMSDIRVFEDVLKSAVAAPINEGQ